MLRKLIYIPTHFTPQKLLTNRSALFIKSDQNEYITEFSWSHIILQLVINTILYDNYRIANTSFTALQKKLHLEKKSNVRNLRVKQNYVINNVKYNEEKNQVIIV